MDHATFARLVREALAHLYEDSYLQRHPLAVALVGPQIHDAAGPTLHRILLEAIEALRPSPHLPLTASPWQRYLVLSHRYIDDMRPGEIAEALSISARQFRRLQASAIEALTHALWERYQRLQASMPSEAGVVSPLDAEVARLGAALPGDVASLGAILEGVVSTLARLAGSRRVSLAVQLASNVSPPAVDRVVLRQILLSVLAYAIDQSAHRSLELTAGQSDCQVHLHIEQRGGPVPAAPAKPGDDRLTAATRLVEMHGGRLTVSWEEHRAIHLALPVGRPPILLVVDDDPNVARLFQRYLAGGAYQVVGATNAQEALRLAQELHPQAMTLDVMMPSQDGWGVLQSLKALPATADIPVVVCSVLRERELALSLGASDLVAKPVSREKLLMALARCASDPQGAESPSSP